MSFINDSHKCKSAYACEKSNRKEHHGGGEGDSRLHNSFKPFSKKD